MRTGSNKKELSYVNYYLSVELQLKHCSSINK